MKEISRLREFLSKKFALSSIVRTILCIAGGITFMTGEPVIIGLFHGSTQDIYFTLVIVVGIITIISSLIGLKYHKIGSYLCFTIGIDSLIFSLLLMLTSQPRPHHIISFILGSVLIISGSLIGVVSLIKNI